MMFHAPLKTSLGDLLLTANPRELTGVYFLGCAHAPAPPDDGERNPELGILAETARQLREYLAGERKYFELALHFAGTAFQQRVWREIARIPFGQTIAYADLAERAGAPRAIRAAGSATGKNPLSIIIPCHRVVGKSGSLGGYAGGLERKRQLLALEQVCAQPASNPNLASQRPASAPPRSQSARRWP
jgi:methylated-DNA-[protein]-cysteine S-methyltransferase